jgi:hypothetical protein
MMVDFSWFTTCVTLNLALHRFKCVDIALVLSVTCKCVQTKRRVFAQVQSPSPVCLTQGSLGLDMLTCSKAVWCHVTLRMLFCFRQYTMLLFDEISLYLVFFFSFLCALNDLVARKSANFIAICGQEGVTSIWFPLVSTHRSWTERYRILYLFMTFKAKRGACVCVLWRLFFYLRLKSFPGYRQEQLGPAGCRRPCRVVYSCQSAA